MSENPHYQAMAQQFLDFWQDQTRRAMHDERFLNAMMEMMSATVSQPSNFNQAGFHAPNYSAPASPFQPTPASAHAGGIELAELLRRIERLEARVAATEDALRQRDGAARRGSADATGASAPNPHA